MVRGGGMDDVAVKWRRLSAEAIASGEWVISRTRHGGRELYTLYRGMERVGYADTAAMAKQMADDTARGNRA